MEQLTLVVGNKNYSSWSLRPWLLLKHIGVPFHEIRIPLYTPESKALILQYSPSGKVPVLIDGKVHVWDTLAIAEYVAEKFPYLQLWPKDSAARAMARSISAEMHAGFGELRRHMSMNCRKFLPGKGRTPEVESEISRIVDIWESCRNAHSSGGPFLFGHFTAADAMYAPVALRFATYDVALPPVANAYAELLRRLPAMQEWLAAARTESEIIPQFEFYD